LSRKFRMLCSDQEDALALRERIGLGCRPNIGLISLEPDFAATRCDGA